MFDLGLKRLPKHRNEVVNAMLTLAHTPPSLSHLARRVVRQQLIKHTRRASIIPAAFKLPLPLMLHQYILLSDVRRSLVSVVSLLAKFIMRLLLQLCDKIIDAFIEWLQMQHRNDVDTCVCVLCRQRVCGV